MYNTSHIYRIYHNYSNCGYKGGGLNFLFCNGHGNFEDRGSVVEDILLWDNTFNLSRKGMKRNIKIVYTWVNFSRKKNFRRRTVHRTDTFPW